MRLFLALALALGGCYAVSSADGPGSDGTAPPWRGVVASPIHGSVVTDETATATVHVAGLSTSGQTLSVQVLASPADLTSWITLATTTATSPTADPTQFWFQVDVTPATDNALRWRQGGVLRLRVIDSDGDPIPYAQSGGEDSVIVLASPSPPPALWTYLTATPVGSAADTEAYYSVTGAPPTLDAFLSAYGFGGADEIDARYYNAGDLGIGREMHCRQTASAGGVGCYVRNFGEFGGDPDDALDQLAAGGTPLATVAMVYTPPITAPNAVSFAVYTSEGSLTTNAQLDTQGDNTSIPENCINCHGGGAQYDASSHTLQGAQFLAFDPSAYGFSDTLGIQLAGQEQSFEQLNQLVLATSPTVATHDLIEGMFGGGYNDQWVPAAWNQSARDRTMYQQVVAPYCRDCHASQQGSKALPFATPDELRAAGPTTVALICGGGHAMPVAQATATQFFDSGARAVMLGWLSQPGDCAPN